MRSLALSLLVTASLFYAGVAVAAERVTAVGKVVDADGNAIEHAAVLVYSAGVKKGFSLFCPIPRFNSPTQNSVTTPTSHTCKSTRLTLSMHLFSLRALRSAR
jgi:hypothetical protein